MPETLTRIIIFTLLGLMLFCNRKANVVRIFIKQITVFKNYNSNKTSIWDLLCFLFFPIIVSVLFVESLDYTISNEVATILSTVFSIIFTVLFGFASIIVGKIESNNKIEKQVIEETFISVLSSTILSLIATILSVIIPILGNKNTVIREILSITLLSISLITIMLMLVITKRTFKVYCKKENK